MKKNYILIKNDNVPDSKVIQTLSRIRYGLARKTLYRHPFFTYRSDMDLSYTRVPIEFHHGAVEIYRRLNLHTTAENNHCIHYIKGQCPTVKPEIFELKGAPLEKRQYDSLKRNLIAVREVQKKVKKIHW